MEHEQFLERIFPRLPKGTPSSFVFESWPHAGRPTAEGMGCLGVAGLDPQKVVDAAWAVDEYVGNVEHVKECRQVPDDRYDGTTQQRFYQRIDLPLLGSVHYELLMVKVPERDGWIGTAWSILRAETDRLDKKKGFRSDYNHGCWLAKPGVIAYGLGSAPKRDDVGFLKWKALTKGADAAASRVLRINVEGMAKWSQRRG